MPNSPPPENQPQATSAKTVSLVWQISKGLVRDSVMRRRLMTGAMMTAVVMLFLGALAHDWLLERRLLFMLYWFGCAWFTFMTTMLALFDILMNIATARRLRKRMRQEMLGEFEEPPPDAK
jgi:hypothetical protein